MSFRWKDYRAKGKTRYKAMTLSPEEFMSRFLLHVLPSGLHRIRHYGLLANGSRKSNLAAARQFLAVTVDVTPGNDGAIAANDESAAKAPIFVCRHCGRRVAIVTAAGARAFDPRTTANGSAMIELHLQRHAWPPAAAQTRASRHANPISDKQMVGGSRSVTIDVDALPHVRAGVRQPLTQGVDGKRRLSRNPIAARTTPLVSVVRPRRRRLQGS